MVDAERQLERLERLERLIELLESVHEEGEATYLADERLRAATERWLQLAEQICIDVGAHIVSAVSAPAPSDYAGIFVALANAGYLEPELANLLAQAAKQRDLLVHAYIEIDNRKVFESLEHLDDLRRFAAAVQLIIDAPEGDHVPDDPLARLRAAGDLSPAEGDLSDLPDPLPLEPGLEPPSSMLARLRSDDR